MQARIGVFLLVSGKGIRKRVVVRGAEAPEGERDFEEEERVDGE